jgi:predicted nucleic acid-binding protein
MLLDTSGLMCLLDKRETRHDKATQLYNSAVRLVCHNYILTEFVALAIARRVPRPAALKFIDAVVRSGEIDINWVGQELHERAMNLLTKRIDKTWSLCDSVSFVIMKEHGVLEALTTDHNFEQAGFVRLLGR